MGPELRLDHLILAVADLEAAAKAWSGLLGRAPSWRGGHPALGTSNVLFRLGESYLELIAADPGSAGRFAVAVRDVLGEREERPFGLALGTPAIDACIAGLRSRGVAVGEPLDGDGVESASGVRRTWRNALVDPATVRGLRVLLIEHTSPASLLAPAAALAGEPASLCDAVDHFVVFTGDLDASREVWQRGFGLEMGWARDFPERRTRNLGLRLGDAIFELVERTGDAGATPRDDFLWGVAWKVGDLAGAAARLDAAGIPVDPPRRGLARGTTVATVRWERTPTLLLSRP